MTYPDDGDPKRIAEVRHVLTCPHQWMPASPRWGDSLGSEGYEKVECARCGVRVDRIAKGGTE